MDQETKEIFVEAMFGDNKSRDYRICEYHCNNPEKKYAEIIADLALDITEDRVCQILKVNQDSVLKLFAKINPLYFKEGRARELVKEFNAKDLTRAEKLEILDALRKEIEGDNKTSIGVIIHNSKNDEDISLKRNDRELQERIREDLLRNRVL